MQNGGYQPLCTVFMEISSLKLGNPSFRYMVKIIRVMTEHSTTQTLSPLLLEISKKVLK